MPFSAEMVLTRHWCALRKKGLPLAQARVRDVWDHKVLGSKGRGRPALLH